MNTTRLSWLTSLNKMATISLLTLTHEALADEPKPVPPSSHGWLTSLNKMATISLLTLTLEPLGKSPLAHVTNKMAAISLLSLPTLTQTGSP
jgi:hypothetical protein